MTTSNPIHYHLTILRFMTCTVQKVSLNKKISIRYLNEVGWSTEGVSPLSSRHVVFLVEALDSFVAHAYEMPVYSLSSSDLVLY
jgi:hypothetical protein